jgi:hypothetical protein
MYLPMVNLERRIRTAKVFRIIARIIGIMVLVFFLAMLIGDAVQAINSEGYTGINREALFVIVPVIVALAAVVVSWRYELTGGILLVFTYLLLSFSPSVHSVYYNHEFQMFFGMFVFAAPFFLAGILFIIAVRLSRESL